MSPNGLIAKPPPSVLYAGLLLVVILGGILMGPLPDWWSVYLPEPVGPALRLREAQFVELNYGCRWQDGADWRRIRAHPLGRVWFEALIDDRATPGSVVYALAGLRELDSFAFAARVHELNRFLAQDSVVVVDADRIDLVPVRSVMAALRSMELGNQLNRAEVPTC